MRAFPLVVVALSVAAVVAVGGCTDEEKIQPTVVSPAQPPPPQTPPVKDAVIGIYRGFAGDPAGFNRAPVLSRFYMTDNARIDADCAAGKEHPRCSGDRFACLPTTVKGRGSVQDAVVTGEQPGVSASVRVTMVFGKATVKPDVDLVFEDGAWKVDQVRCDAPAE